MPYNGYMPGYGAQQPPHLYPPQPPLQQQPHHDSDCSWSSSNCKRQSESCRGDDDEVDDVSGTKRRKRSSTSPTTNAPSSKSSPEQTVPSGHDNPFTLNHQALFDNPSACQAYFQHFNNMYMEHSFQSAPAPHHEYYTSEHPYK
jgi:hypothetical protein